MPPGLLASGPAFIGKAVMAAVAQDDMIEESDSEKFACGLEAMGENAVLSARCGVA